MINHKHDTEGKKSIKSLVIFAMEGRLKLM